MCVYKRWSWARWGEQPTLQAASCSSDDGPVDSVECSEEETGWEELVEGERAGRKGGGAV